MEDGVFGNSLGVKTLDGRIGIFLDFDHLSWILLLIDYYSPSDL